MPEEIKSAILTREEFDDLNSASGGAHDTVDLENAYIVDTMIERCKLGPRVTEIKFESAFNTKRKVPSGKGDEGEIPIL